LVITFPIRFQH